MVGCFKKEGLGLPFFCLFFASIMPIIVGIMLASADQDWGEIAYPVISQG